jgi:hypothetical protein
MGHRGERAPRARPLGGPRRTAASLRIHEQPLCVHKPCRPATAIATSSTASARDRASSRLGPRRLAAAHASHSSELGAWGYVELMEIPAPPPTKTYFRMI